jgi:hypothetical protein
VKAIVDIRRERQITGLRPLISAILGKMKAAIAQPMKRLDPMNPTLAFEAQN